MRRQLGHVLLEMIFRLTFTAMLHYRKRMIPEDKDISTSLFDSDVTPRNRIYLPEPQDFERAMLDRCIFTAAFLEELAQL